MSLRARLLLGMAVVAAVLVVAAVSITRSTEHDLVHQVDEQILRAAPQVRGPDPARNGPGGGNGGGGGAYRPSSLYVATLDADDTAVETLFESNTASQDSAPDLTAAEVRDHADGDAFTVGSVGSDLRYRVVVDTAAQGDQLRVYAQPLEDVDASIHRLVVTLGVAVAAITAALALVTFWVLRLGVRPVKAMTETAAAIGEGDLSRRIPTSAPGTEAGDLGVALNKMLGRIEESFDERARSEERLRQFVADASHELRTPVTTIRGYAELYRLGGLEDPVQLGEAIRRTEQEAERMGQLVGDLLHLARLDEGRPLQLAPVDLAQLAADAVADAQAVEPARPLALDAPDAVGLVGDEGQLRQITANLVANARAHTEADAAVTVHARVEAGHAVLEVADDGPGMAPEVAARAFERFYRADPARTRSRGGSGLGLSIVAGAVAAHGGRVSLRSAPGAGTTVRVELPLVPSPREAHPS